MILSLFWRMRTAQRAILLKDYTLHFLALHLFYHVILPVMIPYIRVCFLTTTVILFFALKRFLRILFLRVSTTYLAGPIMSLIDMIVLDVLFVSGSLMVNHEVAGFI